MNRSRKISISPSLMMNARGHKILATVTVAVLLGFVLIQEAIAGYFTDTGSLNEGRSVHAAALLQNGKVLVAGGSSSSGYSRSIEIYDPSTETWTESGPLIYGRGGFTATTLPNGKVLMVGGEWYGGGISSFPIWQCELYDPVTGACALTANMVTARAGQTATLLPSGKVLVAGGAYDTFSDCTNSAELYDPSTGTWTPTGSMAGAREEHTAVLLPNGMVLVAGGFDGSVVLSTAELYNPTNGTWTAASPMNIAHGEHSMVMLPNGSVLVAGGYSGLATATSEVYDPLTGKWAMVGQMTVARYGHTGTLLADGKVLVAGGYNDDIWDPNVAGYPTSGELYDPTTGTWTATGTMRGRWFHTATLLSNGNVLIAGGSNGSGEFASAQLFVPTSTASGPILSVSGPTNGVFQLSFTNTSGASFIALGSPDLTLALTNWTVLGNVSEISPGQFQFTDRQGATNSSYFYSVLSR